MTRMLPAILALAFCALAQQAPPPAATAQIRGRVIDAESGRPLRHARVSTFSPELRAVRAATTDDQGRYEIAALRAGRYRLGAEKEGYLARAYAQTGPHGAGKWVELSVAQTLENVDVRLPRAGVITGHVVDRYGDPVPNLTVRALRDAMVNGRKALTDETTDTTDDLGAYRLSGLVPARYYVSAVAPPAPGVASDAEGDTDGDGSDSDSDDRAPTYYPGTPALAEGRPLTLGSGEAMAGIDFKIVPTPTARVSGTVVNSAGLPMRGGIEALQIDAAFGQGIRAAVRGDGTFTLSGLVPGVYQLHAAGDAVVDGHSETADARITVADRDIDTVRLTGAPPVRIFGRIVPGPNNFYLMTRLAGNLPPGWTLKAARLNGVDVLDTGIDCPPNHDVRGLELELTDHPARVSGVVVNDRGEPVKDYTVILFPQDDQRWTPESRYVLTAQPDQEGRFTVIAPPRADYLAVALDELAQDAWTDPDVLAQLRDRATAFALGDGETHLLTLTIAPTP